MSKTIPWQGYLNHPLQTKLPCRVVVDGHDVYVETDWGEGWRRSSRNDDYYTITAAAFRDIAANGKQ